MVVSASTISSNVIIFMPDAECAALGLVGSSGIGLGGGSFDSGVGTGPAVGGGWVGGLFFVIRMVSPSSAE
jgi:hypothetical protein